MECVCIGERNDIIMSETFEFLDLESLHGVVENVSIEKQIEAKKIISKIKKQSMEKAKLSECYYCKKEVKGMCNSHTVPAFALKNIAVDGKLYSMNSLINNPFLKDELGIKESGTFHIICRECDGRIFQHYENEDAYFKKPDGKILSEIALKNSLKAIYKRKFEHQLIDHTPLKSISAQQFVGSLDLNDYEKLFKYSQKATEKSFGDEFYLYEYIELNYTVPIAFQGPIALPVDLQGTQINNLYDFDPKYEIKHIEIAILPLQNKSIILLFVEKDNHRYRQFFKQLSKCSLNDKLKIINYIVFAFTEDFFLSPKLEKNVLLEINKIAKLTSFASFNPMQSSLFELKYSVDKKFDFKNADEIPNILLEKYKVN